MTRHLSALQTLRSGLCLLTALCLGGCARAPAFNVLGSFFPGWIACILVGILLTVIVRWMLARFDLERDLKLLPLVYLNLSLFFACTLWLIFFE